MIFRELTQALFKKNARPFRIGNQNAENRPTGAIQHLKPRIGIRRGVEKPENHTLAASDWRELGSFAIFALYQGLFIKLVSNIKELYSAQPQHVRKA